jgi:hypothetical protein
LLLLGLFLILIILLVEIGDLRIVHPLLLHGGRLVAHVLLALHGKEGLSLQDQVPLFVIDCMILGILGEILKETFIPSHPLVELAPVTLFVLVEK